MKANVCLADKDLSSSLHIAVLKNKPKAVTSMSFLDWIIPVRYLL